jgi:serine/threonine protein kinase
MIGTILHDRWRILSNLGQGGMGEVFLAEHLQLGRKEALKILMPSLAVDPQFVSRFRREARAVNRLRHPNIIAIHDFGQLPDQRFFLSMEYADGESVHRILKREQVLEVPRALHFLGQLAYAVHHAHSRGVVHRDLKPGNLIAVGDDETLKVLDFGIAKIVASDHAESVALSSTNIVYGTPKYMSPERARGIGNDPRTDLYAIGCIAYELITGSAPFNGAPNDVIRAHLTIDAPPPSTARPGIGIPPELDAIILRCLAKQPDDRVQTAAELYAALTKVPGYPAPKVEGRRRFVPVMRRPANLDAHPPVSEPDAFGNLRGALRSVAESLLDLGLDDSRLVAGVAYLRDHEQSLARLEAAQDALEHDAAALRETLGERENSLRFALSELEYAAAQPAPPPEAAGEIKKLEARLAAAAADRDKLRALEQGVAQVAASRTAGLAELKATYDALEAVVDEVLPAYANDPTVDPLAHRLRLVRTRRKPGAR